MTRIAIALTALALAGCQSQYIENINVNLPASYSGDLPRIEQTQTRGGQSTSGEIAAEVRDVVDAALEDSPVNVQGGSAGNTQ